MLDLYQAEGFSKEEAAARTSTDLGHGDGRGRYVREVYGRKPPTHCHRYDEEGDLQTG